MNDDSLMPFGKHKGEKMANVPPSYLIWCNDQDWCKGEVKKYILNNLDALKAEIDYKNKSK
jgi:uncharacterized protein (DUF3820 family)